MSTIGMPARISSPSWTSAIEFDFQIDLEDGHAADRGENGHPLGVRFGHPHRVFGAVAADPEDLDVGFSSLPFQLVGRFQLRERRLGLLARQGVLLRVDLGDHGVLEHLELRSRHGAFGDLDLALVLRRRGALLRFALADLLLELLKLGPAVERVGDLLLPVELDDEIAALHGAARPDQPGDDERHACSGPRAGARRRWWTARPRRCRSGAPSARSRGGRR